MKCPACGSENREGARFCRRCGTALIQPPEPADAGNAGSPSETEAEPPRPQTELEAETGEPVAAAGEPEGEEQLSPPEPEAAAPQPDIEAGAETPPEPELQEPPPDAAAEAAAPQADEELEPVSELQEEAALFWREEEEPMEPVPPGTVIDGRYAVIEALDIQDSQILYQAQDMQRCWQCGFDGNAPTEAFCAQCGASLDRKRNVRLLEVRDAEAGPAADEKVVARVLHEGREFQVLAEPEPAPLPPAPALHGIRLLFGQRSIPGQVRELNEDSMLVITLSPVFQSRSHPTVGLFAVADGMGGHEGGEIASKLALQVFGDRAVRDLALPILAGDELSDEDVLARLRQAMGAANDAVYLARHKRETDMGTTLTALLVGSDRLFLAHVGDSRAFRWNGAGLQQLSTDHSVIASMVAGGQIAADEIYTHPHRSVIYRSIGDKPNVQADTGVWPVAPGDRLVVCSDGLWEMIRNEGIADGMMEESEPQALCDLLAMRANAAGGEDNISVVVVRVEEA